MTKRPTFSNIFSNFDPKDSYFSEVPFYSDYLWTIAHFFELSLDSVLDIGCGNAVYGDYIQKHWQPAPSYLGIDIDDELIETLNRKDVKVGDVLNFKSRKKFDLVLCHSVLQYVKDLDLALANLASLVKKTGFVSLAQTMTRDDYRLYAKKEKWNDPFALKRTPAFYRRKILKYFDIIGYGILVPKGRYDDDPFHVDKLFLFR